MQYEREKYLYLDVLDAVCSRGHDMNVRFNPRRINTAGGL